MTNPWPRNSGSIDDLRSALHYDPDTGIFTWVRDSSKWMHNGGQIAGCVDDRGRVLIHFKGVQYKAHRLAWAYVHGYWPPDEIDHKNGIVSDNRLKNLRPATRLQNGKNRKALRGKLSAKGVSWNVKAQRWVASIRVDNVGIYLGSFMSEAEGRAAYIAAAKQYFGPFMRAPEEE
jgi:hypothetical protein